MTATLTLPFADDFHVHLRRGPMMEFVTSLLPSSGVRRVVVMPNLIPPIITVDQALEYKKELESISPSITFLMTLYLTPSLSVDEIQKAFHNKIFGVKYYPKGATTNSQFGIENLLTDIKPEIFEALSHFGIVLHLHGECPHNCSSKSKLDLSTTLGEEIDFLPMLKALHLRHPALKIVLEHVTTRAAVNVVKDCGETVAATITPHHLVLTFEDVLHSPFNYCKPIAKQGTDREALIEIIKSNHPRFFLGSDSAPHPIQTKMSEHPTAGIFSYPHVLPLLATILEQYDALDVFQSFVCENGAKFFGLPLNLTLYQQRISLVKKEMHIPKVLKDPKHNIEIVPFYAGQSIPYSLLL